MPIPEQRDREQTRKALTGWLEGKLTGAQHMVLSELGGPASTGFSNETIIFDASWRERGREHRGSYAIRVQPTAHTVFLESFFVHQYRVIKTLGERTDVPVPPVHWYEDDPSVLGAPFFVMSKVEGQAAGDQPPYTAAGWIFDATPEQQERMWWDAVEVMARIHDLDWRGLGLDFLDRPHLGERGLDQQLAYNQAYFEWAARGEPEPIVEAARSWLIANRMPEDEPDGLCWGDSRIGNMLFQDFEVHAVLDWEMVTIGNPLQDLGWWMFLDRFHSDGHHLPRLPGFPSREATAARWSELTGRNTANLRWYEIYAGYQFGIVMMRLAQLMTQFGLMPEGNDYERDNHVTRELARLLAAS